MNNTNEPVGSANGTSTLVRARFGPGMLLQHEDLELLNNYTRDLSRLLFRSFFGCGVICGLEVAARLKCEDQLEITVGAGVALACSGDPVQVPKAKPVLTNNKFDPSSKDPLWVLLCGTVKCCAPRISTCASDDDESHSDCTREKDGFEIRVVSASEPPKCVCGCTKPEDPTFAPQSETSCQCADPNLKCYQDHYQGKCGCNCDECLECDCACILLARLTREGDTTNWLVDYRVRRFIRPVLMRDPLAGKPKAVLLAPDGQTIPRSVEQAAQDAAVQTVKQAAEQAAQEVARNTAQEIATKVGKRAAEQVVRQVVEQVALEAARKAVEEAAGNKAEPAVEPAGQKASQQAAMQAEQSAEVKKPEKTTKSSKMKKSGLNNS